MRTEAEQMKTIKKLEEFRDKVRAGEGTPELRRTAAFLTRAARGRVKPGTVLRTKYTGDRKTTEIIKKGK